MFAFLLVILILDAFLLVAVVLLQAGQGGGLAAMGGGASTDTFMGGRQAVTLLTKLSWWCGGIFLALCLVLAGLSARGARPRSILEGQVQMPTPVAPLPLNPQGATPAPQPSTQTPAPPGGQN
jgi:preprotein translocase subunit SecG